MVLLVLALLIAGIVAGGIAIKNALFPASEPEVEVEEDAGPTAEDLSNPVDCAPGALDVGLGLAADSLPAGQPANISVDVKNIGEVPCLVDMSKSTVHVTITSGDDGVWASDHCGAGLPEDRRLLLDIDASDTTVVSWPGTRSEKGCAGDQDATKPGTYRISLTVDSGAEQITDEQVFGLH